MSESERSGSGTDPRTCQGPCGESHGVSGSPAPGARGPAPARRAACARFSRTPAGGARGSQAQRAPARSRLGGGGRGEEEPEGARLAARPSRAPGLRLRPAQGRRAAGVAAAAAAAPGGGGGERPAPAPGVRRQDGGSALEAGPLLFSALLRPAARRLLPGLLLLGRCLLLLPQP